MNKEFIPYKESFELKELGFNEPCISKWEEDYICQDEGFDIQNDDTWLTNKGLYFNDKYCSAPLYQQTFKWFRENHDLCSHIRMFNGKFTFEINEVEFVLQEKNTHEEAELTCLRKLIEIIKENK